MDANRLLWRGLVGVAFGIMLMTLDHAGYFEGWWLDQYFDTLFTINTKTGHCHPCA